MSEKLINCPQCGAPLDANVSSCKFCGASISAQQPQYQPQQPQYQPQQPQYQPQQQPQYQQQQPQYQQQQFIQPIYDNSKNKVVAGLLAIFLGGIGIHKFYLGQIGLGIIYLLFCWTLIPAIIAFIEGIVYLGTSDGAFRAKYCKRLN